MRGRLIRYLWSRLPEEEREAWVERTLKHRAMRRAALSPFSRSLEDELDKVTISMIHDFNRQTF